MEVLQSEHNEFFDLVNIELISGRDDEVIRISGVYISLVIKIPQRIGQLKIHRNHHDVCDGR